MKLDEIKRIYENRKKQEFDAWRAFTMMCHAEVGKLIAVAEAAKSFHQELTKDRQVVWPNAQYTRLMEALKELDGET